MKHGKGIMYFSKGKIAKELWNNGILVKSEFINEDVDEDETNSDYDIELDSYRVRALSAVRDTNREKVTAISTVKTMNTNKMITLKVAKYYKARIPNNYFDAMQIVLLTSDLIYSNYSITDWTENDVLTWLHRIGINDNRYDDIIVENSINGLKFLSNTIHLQDIINSSSAIREANLA